MSNPSHSRRDWTLFAGAALVPAMVVGALGLRALSNEEAAQRRATSEAIAAEAVRLRASLERGLARAGAVLEDASERDAERTLDARAVYEALRAEAPPALEPVVMSTDGRILEPAVEPAAPARSSAARTRDAAECGELARTGAKADVLARCEEALTPTGRHLWLSLALEALAASPRDAALVERLLGWIDAHQSTLRASERAGARDEIERMPGLDAGARGSLVALLDATTSSTGEISVALRTDPAVRALRVDRGTTSFRAPLGVGVVRPLGRGLTGAFVMTPATIARAIGRHQLEVQSPDVTASVATASLAVERDREAIEWLSDGVGVRIAARDPGAASARAWRAKVIVIGATVAGALAAAALATLLFARMRAARRTSELRTSFVAAVSHELRTPIASVRMLAELLEEGRVEPDEVREVHEALAREARRLGDTVDRLLGFSRLAAGKVTLDRALGPVAAPIQAAIAAFRERHPGVRVEADLGGPLTCAIDAGQLEVVAQNLLENALKYAPDGQPYRVSLTTPDERSVVIAVRDAGPGIARKDQKRIFEPFERVDDRLHKATEGSGIGLSLVRQIARAHGGDAWVESAPGEGATFFVRIGRGEMEKGA